MSKPIFGNELFEFFEELSANNRREWFQAEKPRFERDVQEPALRFISDFGPRLRSISPHFEAIPKKVGGSLFRIYRDVRFSKDKRPYKTHLGIRFQHRLGKDVHGPIFYLHLEPSRVFAAAGMWRPHAEALKAVRAFIDEDPAAWRAAIENEALAARFDRPGERLKRVPRGFGKEHEMAEELKLKDHIAVCDLERQDVLRADFPDRLTEIYETARPLMTVLCKAVDAPF